ncbi:hypothetical protein CPB86DRAFT_722082 [Serendipita vermifera]|nr:hypothetical protein CPB86DRAFT_722082 [Serendipita vermifera]
MPTAVMLNTTTTEANTDQARPHGSNSPKRPKLSQSSRGSSSKSSSSLKATLRILYDQAKHAFLQKDLSLANKYVSQAFTMLTPPSPSTSDPTEVVLDVLDSHRRKWEILNITLQTTLYTLRPSEARLTSGQASTSSPTLDTAVPPYSFLQRLHAHSLTLFTPKGISSSITYVPDQVVLLLVVSAVKLDEIRLAKEWVEDWLVRRNMTSASLSPEGDSTPVSSYERIVDVYILHILPRLGLWDDAREFLRYESEMSEEAKQRIHQSLQAQHQRFVSGSHSPRRRSPSPSPSLASTISISTATVITPSRPASAASISSSASTATIRPSKYQLANSDAKTATNGRDSFTMTALHESDPKLEGNAARGNHSAPNGTIPNGLNRHMEDLQQTPLLLPVDPMSSSSSSQSPHHHNNSSSVSTVTSASKSSSGYLTRSHFSLARIYLARCYLSLAELLDRQFNIILPVRLDNSTIQWYREHPEVGPQPTLWHVFFVLVPLIGVLRLLSYLRRSQQQPNGQKGAGDMARRQLKAQQMKHNLAVGPSLGLEFWRAAMRAVTDAIAMSGRGLL